MGKKHTFHFKQFSLTDDGCAMKIGTDGVLLGAYAATFAKELLPQRILDVGTGCGLVAMMIAQKSDGTIDAIDIDRNAINTASQNFTSCFWGARLRPEHSPLQAYCLDEPVLYDLIVSNPPYFEQSLKSNDKGRNLARHNDSLNPDDLFLHSARLLNPNGTIILIYPAAQHPLLAESAEKYNLKEKLRLNISPATASPTNRIISEFGFGRFQSISILQHCPLINEKPVERFISIETGKRHHFTDEYRLLTIDYHPFFE